MFFGGRRPSASVGLRASSSSSLFVEFGTDSLKPVLQVLCRQFDRLYIVPVELFSDVFYGVFESLLLAGRELVSEFALASTCSKIPSASAPRILGFLSPCVLDC
jgi:hypothetical protein